MKSMAGVFPGVCFDFSGRVAIVTGAGQGIGKAVALAFARAGAKVAIAEVDAEAGAEAEAEIKAALSLGSESGLSPASGSAPAPAEAPGWAQALAEAGEAAHHLTSSSAPGARLAATAARGDVIFIRTDVADEESVDRMVQQVAQKWGRVDILVNNAGISSPTTGPEGNTLTERPVSAFDRVIAVNLRGPYLCARAVVPFMRRQGGGVIINIASTRALMSEPHTEPYSASKGGLLALTHSLAISLGPDKIRVNAISPGWIEVSDWKKRAKRQTAVLRPIDHAQHPVGRVGRPEDIAAACLFLASEAAGFITGQNLVIDGGMTVKMIYVE